MHLISGPLGTIAGVYETAIDALATRTVGEKTVRPKIIASTATVRRARHLVGYAGELLLDPVADVDDAADPDDHNQGEGT